MTADEQSLLAAAVGVAVGWLIWHRKPEPCKCPPAAGVGGMVAAGQACKRC
jgi:hypothetical protein